VQGIRAISFDLDGTLLDGSRLRDAVLATCGAVAQRWPEVDATLLFIANQGVWSTYWPEVEEKWTLGELDGATISREAWRRALAECGYNHEAAAIFATEQLGHERSRFFRLYEDVPDALEALEARLPLALITNGASVTQRSSLQQFGLEARFNPLIVSAEVGLMKPDVAVFKVVADKLGIEPAGILHVGDSLRLDVAGAKAAGMVAVWLNRDHRARSEADPEPDFELRSLSALPDLVDRINEGRLTEINRPRAPDAKGFA
jgi:putative hydrolase of the HAD superfamily